MTKDEFIERAKLVHFDEDIDYSKVVYVNNRTKVLLIDSLYGEFWQTPSNHLRGHSHPMRRASKISNRKSLTTDEIIRRFKMKHQNEGLDYSKVDYRNMHTKVCIIDPIYGEFWQEPAVHLKGCGHPKRAIEKNAERSRYTNDKFKELCRMAHPDYILDKVEYVASQEKVCVICPKHGEFYACPDALLQGKGCPKCGNHLSRFEDELYGILCDKLGTDNVIKGDKTVLDGMELDIYVPKLNIAIELNGLRWHCEKYKKDKNYHLSKTNRCNEKGVKLIHIFEDEWLEKKEIVIKKILNILKLNNSRRIFARKCQCKVIDRHEAKVFLEKNHIQGFVRSTIYLGCFFCGELVGVMSFIGRNGKFELNRYATNNDVMVIGGGSKLFKYFVDKYLPNEVKTFLDRRYCIDENDNLYTKLGFKLGAVIKPNYTYTNGHGKRRHKFNFRKQKLSFRYGFPLSMTEREMTEKLGYYKIYDCGLFKYVWRRG